MDLVSLMKDPTAIIRGLNNRHLGWIVPDRIVVQEEYKKIVGSKINLDNPKLYNEKLNWLKLYDRKPEYTALVDKYEVKKIVAAKLGADFIIPTIGVWNSFDEIDRDSLPNQFVLKCTHDSGSVMVCKDKSHFDWEKAKKSFEPRLHTNFYWAAREWPYKNVPPRVMAEKYMEDNIVHDLRDYKIHCFNGKPLYIQVIGNRNLSEHSGNQLFYTFDWEDAGWAFGDYPPYPNPLTKPFHLDTMYSFAERLSSNMKYIRVDLYEINGSVYFGELTFYPSAGTYPYNKYYTPEVDQMLGELINLK